MPWRVYERGQTRTSIDKAGSAVADDNAIFELCQPVRAHYANDFPDLAVFCPSLSDKLGSAATFFFGPLSLYFGWKSYRQTAERVSQMGLSMRLLALTPLVIAIATIPLTLMFMQAAYRA